MEPVLVHTDLGAGDVAVGRLFAHQRRQVESASFAYAPEYLARPGAYAIDPQLPLSAGQRQTDLGRTMFGALADTAPDRWGRNLLKKQEAALAREEARTARRLTEVDLLLGVRDDLRQGALRFTVGDGPYLAAAKGGVPALADLGDLLDAADRYEKDEAGLAEIRRLVGAGSSLGGARPKAHVRDMTGRLAIAKFPSGHDDWDVTAWEKVALDLADDAGIDVPHSSLVTVAGRRVLVVDRFDRAADGVRRFGYASAMTMLEAADGQARTYLEIAEAVETQSARPTEDLRELWRRIVFGILVHNTDDHLRNHGFVYRGGTAWRLSPAFDLNPNPDPSAHATAISDDHPESDLGAALDVADYFRLEASAASDQLARAVAAVRTWRVVAARHGLGRDQQERMAPAFAALPVG